MLCAHCEGGTPARIACQRTKLEHAASLAEEHGCNFPASHAASRSGLGGDSRGDRKEFARTASRTTRVYSEHDSELFRLLEKLRAAGVESIVVKGPVLSVRAYRVREWRQYVDLGFLIRARDLLAAYKSTNGFGLRSGRSTGRHRGRENSRRISFHEAGNALARGTAHGT